MPVVSLRKVLVDLAEKEAPNDKIAKIFAFYYPILSLKEKKKFFEDLLYYYTIPIEFNFDAIKEEFSNSINIDEYADRDFRIKSVEISDLRGIPENTEGIPFGINLFEDNENKNAVILANNGVGKSSIFSGMEMIYAQEIGKKKLRVLESANLKKEDYNLYLQRFPGGSRPNCRVVTNDGTFNLENPIFSIPQIRNTLNPQNNFISDFDIYHLGQLSYTGEDDNSFHMLLAKSLGLSEFIEFESLLKQTASYKRVTEKSNQNKLERQISDETIRIKQWENDVLVKSDELLALTNLDSSTIEDNGNKEKFFFNRRNNPQALII